MFRFTNPNTENFKKARKIIRYKRCIICYSRLSQTGIYVTNTKSDDCDGVRCNCCEAFYSPDFEIQFVVFDINGNRKIYES